MIHHCRVFPPMSTLGGTRGGRLLGRNPHLLLGWLPCFLVIRIPRFYAVASTNGTCCMADSEYGISAVILSFINYGFVLRLKLFTCCRLVICDPYSFIGRYRLLVIIYGLIRCRRDGRKTVLLPLVVSLAFNLLPLDYLPIYYSQLVGVHTTKLPLLWNYDSSSFHCSWMIARVLWWCRLFGVSSHL